MLQGMQDKASSVEDSEVGGGKGMMVRLVGAIEGVGSIQGSSTTTKPLWINSDWLVVTW